MIPGFLRGRYAERELAFDLPGLCREAGAHFRLAAVDAVIGHDRVAESSAGTLEFDVASVNIGADPVGLDRVDGVREHAFAVRPIDRVLALAGALERWVGAGTPPTTCVVGGGAAGVEVALAVHARLGDTGRRPTVTLVERAPRLLPDSHPRSGEVVARIVAARGIAVRTGSAVARVTPHAVVLDSGETVPSTLTVWLAGAAPAPVLGRSSLPRGDDGYLLVDRTLRAVDGSPVWGAGDCVTLRDFPWTPKSGVYAVREGPVLAHNLRAALTGGPAREYLPQRHALAILNTADGRAVAIRRGLVGYGRWAMVVKEFIDRRFVARYHV
jgi:NADH dehydrogenase FAD-containing subunit